MPTLTAQVLESLLRALGIVLLVMVVSMVSQALGLLTPTPPECNTTSTGEAVMGFLLVWFTIAFGLWWMFLRHKE
jgi:hypothetical protein